MRTRACLAVGLFLLPLTAPARAQEIPLSTFGSADAFLEYQQHLIREQEERDRSSPPLSSAPLPPETPYGERLPTGEPVPGPRGVDAGGLVKRMGAHVLVLSRDHLHTLRIAGGSLERVAVHEIDGGTGGRGRSFPGDGRAFHEILVSGDVVAAVGPGGVALHRVDAAGRIDALARYQFRFPAGGLREPFPVRMAGGKLVVISALPLTPARQGVPTAALPAVRRVDAASPDTAWRLLVDTAGIYRGAEEVHLDDPPVAHGVTLCDLDGPELDCRARAVYTPGAGRSFVATHSAVFVLSSPFGRSGDRRRSTAYRFPLDGAPPVALPPEALPRPEEPFRDEEGFLRGFYLSASGDGFAVREGVVTAPAGHRVLGVGPLGEGRVVIMTLMATAQGVATYFVPVRHGDLPEVGEPLASRAAPGIPFYGAVDSARGWVGVAAPGYGGAAGVTFLRHEGLRVREVGSLRAAADSTFSTFNLVRPFFLDGRAFTLLGDQVVEVREEGGALRVVQRASVSVPGAGVAGTEVRAPSTWMTDAARW